ncbi:MAG: class I SAM-dependent methyltransferase [Alkalispirochaeta sp.]
MRDFDALAEEWDTPEHAERARRVVTAIQDRISISPRARLLDVGAGTGVMGLLFHDLVDTVLCVDTSPGMLRVLKNKIHESSIMGVEVREHDIGAGPLLDVDPFDIAVSMMVFHHIPDHRNALVALAKMLKPGAYLCIVDLDREDGSFHDEAEGIPHFGFDRDALARDATDAGFGRIEFHTPVSITKDTEGVPRDYPLFLMIATR